MSPRRRISARASPPAANREQTLPVTMMEVVLTAIPTGTRMELRSTFPSLEAMEQLVAMGMEEGMKQALDQVDALLAA